MDTDTGTQEPEEEAAQEDAPLLEKKKMHQSTNRMQDDQVSNELAYQQAIIQDRDLSLREIHEAVIEINGLFTDIGSLVQEQQYSVGKISRRAIPSHQAAAAAANDCDSYACVLLLLFL